MIIMNRRKNHQFLLFGLLFLLLSAGIMAAGAPLLAQSDDACFVSINDSGVTDHSGTDAGALRAAVSAATAGSTLKVAGTCTGVATEQGSAQVVYLDKDLIIAGGYDPTDWSAQPDSAANPTVLDAQQGGRVAVIDNNASLTLSHLTLRNGLVTGSDAGGALRVEAGAALTLRRSRVAGSQADIGGAIFHVGPVQIEQSTLSNNQAAFGGAVYIQSNGLVATTLTVTDSTFAGNTATYSGGAIASDGTLDVTNSTFSGNSAGQHGGAIHGYVSSPFSTTIRYSTFSDNSASSGGGVYANATATLSTSIVANSAGGDCASGVVDGGYNLIEDGSCISQGSSISGDPGLLPLADNGGPTQTHTFVYGSLARNRIPQGTLDCGIDIGADQRGEIRPTGSGCDHGGYPFLSPRGGDRRSGDRVWPIRIGR